MEDAIEWGVDLSVLNDRSTEVSFAKLRAIINALPAHPKLIYELLTRWEVWVWDVEPGTIETYENLYIPYILAHGAAGLPESDRTHVYEQMLDFLADAGLREDEVQSEFLMYCCRQIGPAILPELLDQLDDPYLGPDEAYWFYFWGVAEEAVKAQGEARQQIGDLAIKSIQRQFAQPEELASRGMLAGLLARLGRVDAIETMERAEGMLRELKDVSSRIAANEMRHAVKTLRRGEADPSDDRDLDELLREEVKAHDEWYRTRGPDWNKFEASDDSDEGEAGDEDDDEMQEDAGKVTAYLQAAAGAPLEDLEEAFPEEFPDAFAERSQKEPIRAGQKIGRNDPCPCGSGKKYKKCCLK